MRNSIRRSDGRISVFSLERGLDLDRALDCVHHAGKFGQNAVAGGVDEAAVMLLDHPSISLRCDDRVRIVASSSSPMRRL